MITLYEFDYVDGWEYILYEDGLKAHYWNSRSSDYEDVFNEINKIKIPKENILLYKFRNYKEFRKLNLDYAKLGIDGDSRLQLYLRNEDMRLYKYKLEYVNRFTKKVLCKEPYKRDFVASEKEAQDLAKTIFNIDFNYGLLRNILYKYKTEQTEECL